MLGSRIAIGGALLLASCSYEPLELLSCEAGNVICLDSLPGDSGAAGGDVGLGDSGPPGDGDALVPVAFGLPTPAAGADVPRIIEVAGTCDGGESGINATLTLSGVEPPGILTCSPAGVFQGVVTLAGTPGPVQITISQSAAGGNSTSDRRSLQWVTTLPPPVSAPLIVEACEGATLTWTEPSGIVEVLVARFDAVAPDAAPSSGLAYGAADALGSGRVVGFGSASQYDATGLGQGEHTFVLFGRDALFNWSAGVTEVAILSARPVPDPLDTLVPVTGSVEPFNATLSWTPPTPLPAGGYAVALFGNECAGVPVAVASPPAPPVTFSARTWGQYYWRVRSLANGLCDVGQWSACGHFLVSRASATPLAVAAIADLSGDHTCVLAEDRIPRCWGKNDAGQLGLGHRTSWGDDAGEMGVALPRVDLGGDPAGPAVVLLGGGAEHTCALLGDGVVKCWGEEFAGKLGISSVGDVGGAPGDMGTSLPALDFGGRTVTALAGGSYHSCALFTSALFTGGGVACWGGNAFGQLGEGRGDAMVLLEPSLPEVDLVTGVLQVAAGNFHTCVLLDNGTVSCWGRNDVGQLGVGDTTDRGSLPSDMGSALQAVPLAGLATSLSAGGDHTCAVLADGSVECWGLNSDGQLGIDSTIPVGDAATHVLVAAKLPAPVIEIAAGSHFTCALFAGTEAGKVGCWGANASGQLGNGASLPIGDAPGEMNTLTMVPLPGDVARVRAMRAHVCVLVTNTTNSDRDLYCWGANGLGQLGIGDTLARGDDPNEIEALIPIDVGQW